MKARILEKSEEPFWEEFIQTHPMATIHQTPKWGSFQETIHGRGKYWIVVLEEKNEENSTPRIIGGSLIIRHCLPKGYCWLYAARGPLLNYKNSKEEMGAILKALSPIAKEENAIFFRIDPPIKKSQKVPQIKRFKSVPYGFQPMHTLILDINKTEKEILEQMKPKGRYNIKLATKKGVKIHELRHDKPENFIKDMGSFHDLIKETTKRDGFHGHNMDFYKNMVEILDKNATLYLAQYNEKVIASIIMTTFQDTATYYYGASSNKHRNVMAPYLLQWKAIKDAKHKGCKYYDFLGISPSGAKNHPWQGVTEFKKKFGGHEVSYKPAHQYSFKPLLHLLYRIYKMLKK